MKRVGELPRNSEILKKVRVLLTSSWPKWPMWPFESQSEESRSKFMHPGILMKNVEGASVSTQFRDTENVRVLLTSSWPKWPMWPLGPQTEESRSKFMHSGILMKNEEGA